MIAANFVPPYGAWVTINPVSFFGIRQTLIPVSIITHNSLQAGILSFITVYKKKSKWLHFFLPVLDAIFAVALDNPDKTHLADSSVGFHDSRDSALRKRGSVCCYGESVDVCC